ncbi:MAG: rubrerythrin family protein [Planctomycetota bacterium]
MSTVDNLKNAFAGESQANRKYLAFAKKADEEGLKQVSKLFRAAAEAETVHAHSHLHVLGGVKTTKDNLQDAISGETYEFTKMYPQMIEEAKKEGNKQALQSFEHANNVEKTHAALYQKALNNLGNNETVDYFVCQVCGHTAEKDAPDKCPVCTAPKSKFTRVS